MQEGPAGGQGLRRHGLATAREGQKAEAARVRMYHTILPSPEDPSLSRSWDDSSLGGPGSMEVEGEDDGGRVRELLSDLMCDDEF